MSQRITVLLVLTVLRALSDARPFSEEVPINAYWPSSTEEVELPGLGLVQHSAFLVLKSFREAMDSREALVAPPPHREEADGSGGGEAGGESPWKVVLVRICFPLFGCFVGTGFLLSGYRTAGLLAVYFGVNTGFSLYTKFLLMLVPAPFFITACQQVVSVTALFLALVLLSPTPWSFWPRHLTSSKEVIAVLVFALAFSANIGLNNFSLSLLPVSMNLTIRSCLPLVALLAQVLSAPLGIARQGIVRAVEVALVVVGTACACLAAWAQGRSHGAAFEAQNYFVGVSFCALSVVAAAAMLVLADMLSSRMSFSPLDTTWYMSLPSALFLMPAVAYFHHPTDWPALTDPTDLQVLRLIVAPSNTTLCLILCSGLFALGHNVLLYFLIQTLSPSHVAFAGNVNKAMTIASSMILGLEAAPHGPLGLLRVAAMLGNIATFASYSMVKSQDSNCEVEVKPIKDR